MPTFISCDWGTSTFRLRLVDASRQVVLAEVTSDQGIAATHMQWRKQASEEGKRFSFYQTILQHQLKELQDQTKHTLQDRPLILSGMASSSIGMVELPYKELPFAMDGNDLEIKKINATSDFRHEMIVLSGAKTKDDVMRGEETQLIGCDVNDDEDRIFIFPGTHSKHVYMKNKSVVDFKTYMTGEFFRLLTTQSILSNSVLESNRLFDGEILKRFEEGVAQSLHDNVLHNAFLVRTNYLLGELSKEENYYYLSGLLIGTELKELLNKQAPLTIVGNESIRKYYAAALKKSGIGKFEIQDADRALVNGHCKIYQLLQQRSDHPNKSELR